MTPAGSPTGPVPAPVAVLLVDDEEILRRLLARALAGVGFQVLEAANGAEALKTALTLKGKLSLVVTDIRMPVMDGLDFALAFRPHFPTVPILFMTGKEPLVFPPTTTGTRTICCGSPLAPNSFSRRWSGCWGKASTLAIPLPTDHGTAHVLQWTMAYLMLQALIVHR